MSQEKQPAPVDIRAADVTKYSTASEVSRTVFYQVVRRGYYDRSMPFIRDLLWAPLYYKKFDSRRKVARELEKARDRLLNAAESYDKAFQAFKAENPNI